MAHHNEPVDFTHAKLTIEHVLLQSLSQEWRDMLADEVVGTDSVEESYASLVHTLGNLSLTAYNAKLSSDGLAAKMKILSDSGLAMNRDIADSPRWGAAEIRERGRALAGRALRIWPGPTDVADTAPVEPQWWRMNQILACIPAGRWTSYSDVAEVIGTHQVAVGAVWRRLSRRMRIVCSSSVAKSRQSFSGSTRIALMTRTPY